MAKYAIPAALPGAPNAIVSISDVQLPSVVTLSTTNLPDPYEMVQVDLSTKPMIWLVWAGTFLYTFGGLVAYRKRAIEFGDDVIDD
jgi:cytochrome c biogenesis factor